MFNYYNVAMNFKTNKIFGIFLAAFSVSVWGVTFVSTKYLLSDFNAYEILFSRLIIAYICLWIMKPKVLIIHSGVKELNFALAGWMGVLAYQLLENLAINYTNASNVSIIVSLSPIFTAVALYIFLKQRDIKWNFFVGFIIAIVGVALVSFNGVVDFNLNPKGDVLAFGCCVCWGLYSVYVSKVNGYGYNQIQSTRRIFMYALVFMFPAMILQYVTGALNFNPERFAKPMNLINLVFLGAVASAMCFVFWNHSCKVLGTVYTSIAIYLIPVVTIIFAFIFLGERLSLMGIIGTILAVAGMFVSGYKKRK